MGVHHVDAFSDPYSGVPACLPYFPDDGVSVPRRVGEFADTGCVRLYGRHIAPVDQLFGPRTHDRQGGINYNLPVVGFADIKPSRSHLTGCDELYPRSRPVQSSHPFGMRGFL